MFPEQHGWTKTTMLLAELVDTMHWLQWAKTRDGQRNRNQPRRVPRPGVVTEKSRPGAKPKPMPLSVMKQRFAERYQQNVAKSGDIKRIFDGR